MTPAARILCIVNPLSGGGRGAAIAEMFRSLRVQDVHVSVLTLGREERPPDPERAGSEYSDIVIAGGDGTFSSVLAAYVGTSLKFHLLPLGTGNDLARELAVSRLWRGSAEKFLLDSLRLPIQTLTIWKVSIVPESGPSRCLTFSNYLSLGWDAAIVARFDALRRMGHPLSGRFGPWGNRLLYGLSGLQHPFVTLPEIDVATEHGLRVHPRGLRSIVISNIRSVMGLGKIHRQGAYSDDELEILPIPRMAHYAQMLLPFSLRSPAMRTALSAKHFSLSFHAGAPPVALQVDGEVHEPLAGGSMSFSVLGQVLVRTARLTAVGAA